MVNLEAKVDMLLDSMADVTHRLERLESNQEDKSHAKTSYLPRSDEERIRNGKMMYVYYVITVLMVKQHM